MKTASTHHLVFHELEIVLGKFQSCVNIEAVIAELIRLIHRMRFAAAHNLQYCPTFLPC